MDPLIAVVLSVGALLTAGPPVAFALAARAPRLAIAVGAVGAAAPVLFLFWVPIGIDGDFYTHLGAFLGNMPALIGAVCFILCAIVWSVWWLKARRARNGSVDD